MGPEEVSRIIKEIHQGVYGVHERAIALANKIFRQWYYWPRVKKEAGDFVKTCDIYQRFANVINMPAMS